MELTQPRRQEAARSSTRTPPRTTTPKHVLVAVDFLGRGGTETHVANLCRLLRGVGAQVTLATRRVDERVAFLRELGALGITHVSTPFAGRSRLQRLSQYWAYLTWPFRLRRRFDFLYTLGIGRVTTFLAAFLRPGGRVLWHPVGNPDDNAAAARGVPGGLPVTIIAESPIHERRIREALGERQLPIVVLGSLHTVSAAPAPSRLRRDGPISAAFLGRFDANKGVLRLCEMWPRLRDAGLRLHFHGDGPLRAELEAFAERSGGEVVVGGPWESASELGEILRDTDLVLLPSASEGIPLTLLEAMAHGVPFVASDVGAIPHLAVDNDDVLVAPLDEDAFVAAVQQMVARIRSGRVDPARLIGYCEARYGHEHTARSWKEFLGVDATA